MFRKYTCLLLFFCLCGCDTSTSPNQKEEHPSVHKEESGDLRLHELTRGDGNTNGFYHLLLRDVQEESIGNIYYYDYATKKEIFLCDKPECEHKDDTCTSYIDPSTAFTGTLFVNEKHVYVLTNDIQSLDASMNHQGPQIIQMDLDGKNRHVLTSLPEGYQYSDNALVMDEQYVYLPLSQTKDVELASSTYMQVTTKSTVFRIHLSNGECEEFLDSKDKRIIGGDKDTLIFASYSYEQDPEALLQAQDFAAYDQVMMNAKLQYTSYDIPTKTFGKMIDSPSNTIGIYQDHQIFEQVGNDLHAISLETGEDQVVASLPQDALSYTIQEGKDGHIFIDGFQENFETSGITNTYVLDLTSKQLTPFLLLTDMPKQHAVILGETKDAYFVYYDHTQHLEKTWAGTNQYIIDQVSYGMIKKEEYWNSQPNFQPFETITIQ